MSPTRDRRAFLDSILSRLHNRRNFTIFLQRMPDGHLYEFGTYVYTGTNLKHDMALLAKEPRNVAWLAVCDPMQASVSARLHCGYAQSASHPQPPFLTGVHHSRRRGLDDERARLLQRVGALLSPLSWMTSGLRDATAQCVAPWVARHRCSRCAPDATPPPGLDPACLRSRCCLSSQQAAQASRL